MPPWLYALMFISVMLAVAWTVDRRNSRVRRPLLHRPAAIERGPAATSGRHASTDRRR